MKAARCAACGRAVSVAAAVLAVLRARENASAAEIAEELGEEAPCVRVALTRLRARGVIAVADREAARGLIRWRVQRAGAGV